VPRSKLTLEAADSIVADVEHGVPLKDAARCAGIGRRTVYEWKERDPAFAERLEVAEAAFICTVVRRMWQSLQVGQSISGELEILARKRPREYGRRQKVEHEHGAVQFTVQLPDYFANARRSDIAIGSAVDLELAASEERELPSPPINGGRTRRGPPQEALCRKLAARPKGRQRPSQVSPPANQRPLVRPASVRSSVARRAS
jgi:hypothetical protein